MKTHAIIPVFIPHLGCENDCVFCNQKFITAKSTPVTVEDAEKTILQYLSTLRTSNSQGPEIKNKKVQYVKTIEIAFFGGSFTGLDIDLQNKYLNLALKYKNFGFIQKIHLSTRPDYINKSILNNLKKHSVDVIELGVQSFDKEVLEKSKRGHSVEDIYNACDLIKSYGFTLGIQLMIGLPSDTKEKSIESAVLTAKIKPSIARLYPTLVLPDTELYNMVLNGHYTPIDHDLAVDICKEMYKILTDANINIIRVGLKSTDLVNHANTLSSNYHPAFRQIVESEIAKESIESQLKNFLSNKDNYSASAVLKSNSKSFSNLVGHNKSNKNYFIKIFPNLSFSFKVDLSLAEGEYQADLIEYNEL